MTDLLRTPSADRTQDYELEGVDFVNPVQVMGAVASKELVPPFFDDDSEDEIPYFGD